MENTLETWLPLFKYNGVELAVIIALFLLFVIQLVYYLGPYKKLYRYAKTKEEKEGKEGNYTTEQPSVSVILYSDNDAEGIKGTLANILDQEYPAFEVIVVSDRYTEESQPVFNDLKNKYNNLYTTYIPENSKALSRKKLAITIAAKAAKNEILLFAEPHAVIESRNWIARMVRNYTSGVQIVIGYSHLISKKKYLSGLAAYDNLFSAIRYLGKAVSGKPYKGLSRNLSYKKSLFFDKKGFSKYLFLQAGEDDLFVNQNATESNTKVELSPESIPTYSVTKEEWKNQKMRYSLTARYYPQGIKTLYHLEVLSRYLFYATFIAIVALASFFLFKWTLGIFAGIFFITRYLIQYSVINKTAKILKDRKFYLSIVYFDLFLPIINLYYRIYRKFDGKKDYTYIQ
ncbi:MAG: glycosyltransferase [Candidatus Azobacteroides sp.]|nr:glycosyltransferase [Candidatus Azobacteroides sp.]